MLCVEKWQKKKNLNVSGVTRWKRESSRQVKCVSIKVSMRMLAADEDESAMVALFCSFLRVCVDGNG
jgi:hypothetical protein